MTGRLLRNALGVVVLPLMLVAATAADTPVADAAQRGDVDTVRELLRRGADVNAAQGDGMTALHWAARLGNDPLGEMLLYAGANPEAGTRIGRYTPLHMAARQAHSGMVATLLAANADPDAATTGSGATPLHLASATGDARIIAALVEAGATVDVREAAWGQTPLMFAAANNRVDAIRALLDAGADPAATAQTVDVVEQAEADRAAERRLEQLLEQFKEKEGGGDDWRPAPSQVQAAIEASREVQRNWPDAKEVEDEAEDDDATEEEESTEEGSEEESAEEGPPGEGADEEAAPEEGPAETDPPEEGTAESGPPEEPESDEAPTEEEAAAEAKPDATQTFDAEGNPVELGASEGESDDEENEPKRLSYVQLVGTWGGLTPLLHAVRQGHSEAASALLDGGADIDQRSDADGTAPLLMATLNGQFDLALELLERGADPNLVSAAGTSPLFATLERQWAPRASYAHPTEHRQQNATHLDMIEALLEVGADPNARLETHLWFMEYTFSVLGGSGINLQGATPFWRAAYALDVEAMRLLKAWGADPNIPTLKPPQRRRRGPPPPLPDEPEGAEEGEGAVEPDSAQAEGEDDEPEAGEADAAEPEAGEAEEDAAVESSDAEGVESEPEKVANPNKANAEGESAEEETEEESSDTEEEDEDFSGVPPVPVGGAAIYPIHAASGVGYGQSFAGNAHRYVPDNWLAAVEYLVEEAGAEIDVRDANAYTALHHAASRGDNEMILYLVSHGADVAVLSRKGQTTADMANGPVQRVPAYLKTISLLEKLGSKNNHKCVSC